MTINQTVEFINGLKNFPLKEQTEQLLKKYSWDLRFQEENTLLPLEEFEKVQNQIKKSWTPDFQWQGNIPFISYANLMGLRDYIIKSDDDSVVGIVAPPGTGKSTFTLSCAKLIDPSFTNERTIFTMEQLKNFLKKVTQVYNQIKDANKKGGNYKNPYHGAAVVLDEGLYLLFSGDASSKDGKLMTKLFSIIRALGIIFLVNITNWKRISKGVKEDRFKAIFRIPVKGVVQFFSQARINKIKIEKDRLSWPKPNFYEKTGFISHTCQFWKNYDSKKSEFLFLATHEVF